MEVSRGACHGLKRFHNGAQKGHVELTEGYTTASKPAHEDLWIYTKDPCLKCRLFHKLYECKNEGTKNDHNANPRDINVLKG